MSHSFKMPALVIMGNILDYYDFVLFAHLGYIILPLFTPEISPQQSHLFSLFLLSVMFVIRPVGAYVLGRISDLISRKVAISRSILWIGIATLGLALLPSYDQIGIISLYLLIFFRILQGASVGGEYPSAGTYLMESYPNNRGLFSGILSASTNVGSIIAFGFSWICIQEWSPEWLWRVAFLIGGLASLAGYFLRKNLEFKPSVSVPDISNRYPASFAIMTTLIIGFIAAVLSWLPLTYSNFYITKILNYPASVGLLTTLIGIGCSILVKPMIGKISDRYHPFSYLYVASFLTIPLTLVGFYMIMHAIIWGQLLLVVAGSLFQAPVHAIINVMFPRAHRARSVNVCFMVGASLGGLVPSMAGYIVTQTQFHFFPSILCASMGLISGLVFFYFSRKILLG